jgi:hypothetical protein
LVLPLPVCSSTAHGGDRGALEKKKINAHVHVQKPSKSTHPPRFFFGFFLLPFFAFPTKGSTPLCIGSARQGLGSNRESL